MKISRREKIDFSELPESDLVVARINKRFKQGLGTNIYVIGLSGTGKSSTSQRISELVKESRDNKPNTFLVDSLLDLLKAIRATHIGDIIIIEEVSVLFSSRRSMAGENVAVSKIFDTIRKRQLTIISNAPLWNSIDSHMRAMAHLLIETLKINKTQKVVISKFHELQTNPSSGKTYRHTMRREGFDVSRMFTNMPDLDRWDEYERNKEKFMRELYRDLEHKEKQKKEKKMKEMDVKPKIKELTDQELYVHQHVNFLKEKKCEVAKQLNVSSPRITEILKNINKKTEIPKENHYFRVKKAINPPIELNYNVRDIKCQTLAS